MGTSCDTFLPTDDIDEENYGLIRPSLIRQLRSILDQYPDDGQILKVSYTTSLNIIIQNN